MILIRLDEFPVLHLDDDHGVNAQAVMVVRGQVVDAGDAHVAFSLFDGLLQGFGVGAGLFHGFGHDHNGIPGVAGMGVEGELLVEFILVFIEMNEIHDDRLLGVIIRQLSRGHELGGRHAVAFGGLAGQFDVFGIGQAVTLEEGQGKADLGQVFSDDGSGRAGKGEEGADFDGLLGLAPGRDAGKQRGQGKQDGKF